MSIIVPPAYGQAAMTLIGTPGTPDFITTMGVKMDSFTDNYQLAADFVFDCYAETLMKHTSNQLTLDRVSLLVGGETDNGSVISSRPAVVGSVTIAPIAVAMAPIARKATSVLGRRGRGRMFLPATLFGGDVDASGTISAGRVAALNTGVTQFYQFLSSVPGRTGEAAATRYDGKVAQPYLLHSSSMAPTEIYGLSIAPLVGWIRKRIR